MFLDKRQILLSQISSKITLQRFVCSFWRETCYCFIFVVFFCIYIHIFQDVDITWGSRMFAFKAILFLVGEGNFIYFINFIFLIFNFYFSFIILLFPSSLHRFSPTHTSILITHNAEKLRW